MYDLLDTSTPNSGLGTPLRSGGEIINANFRKLHAWMESRSNIATSTIPTLAAGGPAYLLAVEFVPGNPMPLAIYERTSTAPSDVTNPGWVRSLDLQWWKLLPQGGVIYAEQFGSKADSGSGGAANTDNLGPLQKMLAFITTQNSSACYKIQYDAGYYYFSDAPEVHTLVHISGAHGGYEQRGATHWRYPPNKQFIRFRSFNTTGNYVTSGVTGVDTSTGSTFEHIILQGSGASTTFDQHGIDVDVVIHLNHVSVVWAAGHAYYIHADPSVGTISDFSTITRCSVQNCRGDGLNMNGNDANVIHVSDFSCRAGEVWGCGINNSGVLGNLFTNIHVAGYRNVGVWYAGKIYVAVEAGIDLYGQQPGTNNGIWYHIGDQVAPSLQYPAWSATPAVSGYGSTADPYRASIAVVCSGGPDVFVNLYVEGDGRVHVDGEGMVIGGRHNSTSHTNAMNPILSNEGMWTNMIGAIAGRIPGGLGYSEQGGTTFVRVGDRADRVEYRVLNWQGNGGRYRLSLEEGNMVWVRDQGGGVPWSTITMANTSYTFGRDNPLPDKIEFTDFGLRPYGDGGFNASRLFGIRDNPPAGPVAKGEFYFNRNTPEQGTLGWACIAGGSGTWGNVPIFGPTSVTPQRNGELVVECTSNTLLTFKYRGTDGSTRTGTMALS